MAKQYGRNEAVDFAAANLVSFGGSFTRLAGQPIDKSSLWYPQDGVSGYDRAAAYAASSAAYVGQELAVISFIYAEDGETITGTKVTFYGIQDAEGTLKELGAVPVGDDTTIEVDTEGKISLKGISGLAFERDVIGEDGEPTGAKEEIKYQALLTKDGLTWVEPSKTTVEGLASLISALESKTTQIESAVSANTSAISAEVTAREQAIEGVNGAISSAVETLEGAIADAKSELEGAIADETAAREAAIGKATEGETAATGVYAAIEAALAEAKKYADDNDTDTVYDDTEVVEDIADHETRIGAIETAIGDSSKGLIKALADEVSAREQGDTNTLNTAKGYTDEQITGLDIVIEKKTVDEVESDYIVIKNKSGDEVASVNAAKFVKDGMLESAVYSTDTKKLTLTWNTDAGKTATEIDLNDLVNTYIGSEHIIVGTDGKISITDDVALEADLTALETAFDKAIEDEAKARDDADKAIGERIDGVVADVALKAVKTEVEAALADKADKSALETHVEAYDKFVEDYAADKETFATKTDLDNKVDTTAYNNDKATFATKTEVNGQFTAVGQRIGLAEADIEANATAIEDLEAEVAETYATKEALKATDDKAVSNTTAIANLDSRLNGIVAQGGEPNVINNIKVNGVVQSIAEDKSVDISVPVISEVKVEDLNDGQAIIKRVADVETDVKALDTAVSGNQTGITALTTRVAALEAEVVMGAESRIDALEAIVNGVENGPEGIVAKVTTHTTEIAGLKTRDTELATLIQGNTKRFEDYYTKTAIDGIVDNLEESIANVDLSSRLETSVFETYKTAQKELTDTLATKAELAATDAEVAKKANKTELANYYTKDEANAEFMTEAEVKATVDAVVAAAVDTDTLEGLAQLVTYVHENAGDIAKLVTDVENNGKAIEANASAIAANKAAHEKNASDIAALITNVAAQKVIESTEISTSTVEGGMQLGIKEVNVNKLVQTEGDVLILNGGSATV